MVGYTEVGPSCGHIARQSRRVELQASGRARKIGAVKPASRKVDRRGTPSPAVPQIDGGRSPSVEFFDRASPGDKPGPYQIFPLGTEGTGEIYKARNTGLWLTKDVILLLKAPLEYPRK